uniref:Putative reverse transcriptase domain-containing protein n=1 Tax=Tanacetum cinerariifolium TaxID=118510 RepID=A0A699GTA1_TANCI|nr:putative reverse transcriptase domain-containing protein [Tanacetum cinerariifolium]
MHQRRWIELFSDYDCEIRYHHGKANVVADALSRKERIKSRRIRDMNMTLHSSIKDKIQAAQNEAFDESTRLPRGLDELIERRSDGALYYLDRVWVPLKGDVRALIIDEAYKSKCSVQPRADKMYYDRRDMYWWPGMKKDIVVYAEVGERKLIGPKLVQETTKKISQIKDTLKAARDRVVRFGKNGKLAPRFIGPFEITERIGPVAYRLRLPKELNGVHDKFNVSNLKKCLADPTLHIPLDEIRVNAKLNIVEEHMEILEREFKKLKQSRISIVKTMLCAYDCYVNDMILVELVSGSYVVLLWDFYDYVTMLSDDCDEIELLKAELSHRLAMKNLGLLHYVLGIKVASSPKGYLLSQSNYIVVLFDCSRMTDNKIVDIPLDGKYTLTYGDPLHDPSLYHTIVGSLVYLTGIA